MIFSAQLLHQQAPALLLIELKLDRRNRLRRMGVGGLDRPEYLTGLANEDDAKAALHPGGELDLAAR